MKKQIVLLIMFITAFRLEVQAQNTFNRAYRRVVDSEPVPYYISSAVVTDTILYLTGNTYYKDSIYWKEGGFFAKMDYQGNIIQDKMLGHPNRSFTSLYNNLQKDKDGTFYYTGDYFDGVFLTRLNEKGDTLLVKDFSKNEFGAYSVRSTYCVRDVKGNFYFFIDRFYTIDDTYCFFLKTDSLGNEIWRKIFRLDGYSVMGLNIAIRDSQTFWLNIAKVKDRKTNWTFRQRTMTIAIDTSGNILSQFETPANRYIGCSITPLKNGDYLLNGSEITHSGTGTRPFIKEVGYIARYNRNGQQLWERISNTSSSWFDNAVENSNGSIVAAGQVYIDNSENWAGMLWKLSAMGDSLWARRHQAFNYADGLYDYFIGIQKMPDGGFIAHGRTTNNDRTRVDGGFWGWMVRTDSLGCVERGCHLRDAVVELQGQSRVLITVFPNPATHNIHFTWQDIVLSPTFLTLYDVSGKIVVQQPIEIGATQTTISVENQPNGIYFYKMNFGNRVAAGKVVVAK